MHLKFLNLKKMCLFVAVRYFLDLQYQTFSFILKL